MQYAWLNVYMLYMHKYNYSNSESHATIHYNNLQQINKLTEGLNTLNLIQYLQCYY